jgi:hypothetical protein
MRAKSFWLNVLAIRIEPRPGSDEVGFTETHFIFVFLQNFNEHLAFFFAYFIILQS